MSTEPSAPDSVYLHVHFLTSTSSESDMIHVSVSQCLA